MRSVAVSFQLSEEKRLNDQLFEERLNQQNRLAELKEDFSLKVVFCIVVRVCSAKTVGRVYSIFIKVVERNLSARVFFCHRLVGNL